MTKIRAAFEDADIPAKPQLHTRKHHHAYNGARGLPNFTCVKPLSTTIAILLSTSTSPSSTATSEEEQAAKEADGDTHGKHDMQLINEPHSQASSSPASSTPVSTEFTESEDSAEALYQVKLYYPQNRACTIYRSWDDFILLRRGLDSTRYKSLPESDDDDNGAVICAESHSHDSTCLHQFLKYVMERCSTSEAEPAVEYFLRRRMDDCDGGGNGSDFVDIW
ncbi:hypothetical protein V8F06_001430 [Rhypophila decipiens]